MAKSDTLPGFSDKRAALFGGKVKPEHRREVGMRFMEAERYDDALEFLSRADAEDEVRKIAAIAVERGDTPLFLRAKVVLKEEPAQQELVALARKAEAAGRPSMAKVAYLKAGLQEEADRLGGETAGAAGDGADEPEGESGPQSQPDAQGGAEAAAGA